MKDFEKETWTSTRAGDLYLETIDAQGNLKTTVVRSGGKITLTPMERQINQERAYSDDVDFFKNGALVPVRLLESAEDYAEIANNPNHIDEKDMLDILKLNTNALKKRLSEVTNDQAVERMLELARDEDNDLDITMAKFRAIENRLTELRPDEREIVVDEEIDKI